MKPWSRTPREVYAVYGEDEYLAGGDAQGPSGEDGPPSFTGEGPSTPLVTGPRYSRSGRLIGLGLLMGVIAGAVGLVVADSPHTHVGHGARQTQGAAAGRGDGRATVPTMARRERTQTFRWGAGAKETFRSGADASFSPTPLRGRSRAKRSRTATSPPNEVRQSLGTSQPVPDGPARPVGGEFDFER